MQTKTMSLIETGINIITGFIMSMIISHFVLPYYLGVTPSLYENFKITLIFTVFSFIRGYYVRRGFNFLVVRHLNRKAQK